MVEIYFSQTFVIYFCWRFTCCPYYRSVCNSEVSTRRELTVNKSDSSDVYVSVAAVPVEQAGN